MLQTKLVEIGPLVPEKEMFEGFFTIYGRSGHLGHATRMLRTNFRPLSVQGGFT